MTLDSGLNMDAKLVRYTLAAKIVDIFGTSSMKLVLASAGFQI